MSSLRDFGLVVGDFFYPHSVPPGLYPKFRIWTGDMLIEKYGKSDGGIPILPTISPFGIVPSGTKYG